MIIHLKNTDVDKDFRLSLSAHGPLCGVGLFHEGVCFERKVDLPH